MQHMLFYCILLDVSPCNFWKTSIFPPFLRSMWWNSEIPSVTLMLRKGLSLKSQITQDKKQLRNLSQSKSQVLPNQEFRWKPLKIDQLLLGVEKGANFDHHVKVRGAPKDSGRKHSLLEWRVTSPRSGTVPFPWNLTLNNFHCNTAAGTADIANVGPKSAAFVWQKKIWNLGKEDGQC